MYLPYGPGLWVCDHPLSYFRGDRAHRRTGHHPALSHLLAEQGKVLAAPAIHDAVGVDIEAHEVIVEVVDERWDGDGYPRGLRGEQIPLIGRLLAVIDSFDAMTSQRPYQRALTDVEACMELQRCAGTQYDPLFVDAFLCMLSMQNPSIPSWSFPTIQLSPVNKSAIA